ncbi:hypothetical protein BRARA_C02086, partial [Brassica rapa]
QKKKKREKNKEENQCCYCCVWRTFSMVRGTKRCFFISCYPFIRCLGFEERRHRHHLHNHNRFLISLSLLFFCV